MYIFTTLKTIQVMQFVARGDVGLYNDTLCALSIHFRHEWRFFMIIVNTELNCKTLGNNSGISGLLWNIISRQAQKEKYLDFVPV